MQDLAKTKINIKSPAKINLHLEVIGKREDGFHELAMIMQNIDLADYLEFEINNQGLIKLESDCNDLSLSDDNFCLLYTSPSPRDKRQSRMPSSA